MSGKVLRYQAGYCRFESAYNGRAVFVLSYSRRTRVGTRSFQKIELELSRSDIRCVYNALKAFADAERKAVEELPL